VCLPASVEEEGNKNIARAPETSSTSDKERREIFSRLEDKYSPLVVRFISSLGGKIMQTSPREEPNSSQLDTKMTVIGLFVYLSCVFAAPARSSLSLMGQQ